MRLFCVSLFNNESNLVLLFCFPSILAPPSSSALPLHLSLIDYPPPRLSSHFPLRHLSSASQVNKQQLQAVKERFLAFLNGDTQIVADEAFCNAVRSYYEARPFYYSRGPLGEEFGESVLVFAC